MDKKDLIRIADERLEQARLISRRRNLGLVVGIIFYESLWLVLLFKLWGAFYFDGIIEDSPHDQFAITIIGIWMMIIIPYLTWLIYYYNISWGFPGVEWARIYNFWEKNPSGFYATDQVNPIYPVKIPSGNPYANETMGIPKGTIRGVLAMTVSIGAFAMMVSAMGKDSSLSSNQFFVDNLEFFKSAFLMVMAFYFGTKGLEILRQDYSGTVQRGQGSNSALSAEEAPNNTKQESQLDWANEEFTHEENTQG